MIEEVIECKEDIWRDIVRERYRDIVRERSGDLRFISFHLSIVSN